MNGVKVLDEYCNGLIAALEYGTKVITNEAQQNTIEHFKNEETRKHDERGGFVFINLEHLKSCLSVLTYKDIGYAAMLISYVKYNKLNEDYSVIKVKGEPLDLEMLSQIWGLKIDTTRKKVSQLVKGKVLVYTNHLFDSRKKTINFHKNFLRRGALVQDTILYTKVYKKKLTDYIYTQECKSQCAASLGLFFVLLLSMNIYTQLIIEPTTANLFMNQDEIKMNYVKNVKKYTKPIKLTSLRNQTGIKENRTIKMLQQMLLGAGLIGEQVIEKKRYLVVHPHIVYSQDNAKRGLLEFLCNEFF